MKSNQIQNSNQQLVQTYMELEQYNKSFLHIGLLTLSVL